MKARKFITILLVIPALLVAFSLLPSCKKKEDTSTEDIRKSHQLQGTWQISYLTGQKNGRPIIFRNDKGEATPETDWDATMEIFKNEIINSEVFTKPEAEQKPIIDRFNENFKDQLKWLSALELTIKPNGEEGHDSKNLTFTFKSGDETYSCNGVLEDGHLVIDENKYPVKDENNSKDWCLVKWIDRFLTQTFFNEEFSHKSLTVLTTPSFVINNIVQGAPVEDASKAKKLKDEEINFATLYQQEAIDINGTMTMVNRPRENVNYSWKLVFWKK